MNQIQVRVKQFMTKDMWTKWIVGSVNDFDELLFIIDGSKNDKVEL